MADTTSPMTAEGGAACGAHFWLRVPDGYAGVDTALPVPVFHAVWHEGQFVTIVPARDVVVVRLGSTRYRDAWDRIAFLREVLAALDRPAE